MAKTKKWQQLYASTMKWQRRAQAKQRRLKNQGVTNLAEISPVRSARDLQGMSYRELERYRHSLNEFTDRNTAFTILPSGQAVDRRELRKLRRTVSRVNRMRGEVRRNLMRQQVVGAADLETRYRDRSHIDWRTGKRVPGPRGTGAPWEPVTMSELPKDAKTLQRRLETARQMLKHDFPTVIAGQRRAARAMAEQTGNAELVDAIDSMTDFQLSFAIERLGILENLSLYYTSKDDQEQGRIAMAELDPEGYADMQQRVIEDAELVGAL